MDKLINQRRKFIFGLSILAVLSLLVFNWQNDVMHVSAQVLPISVNVGHLEYGNVFPGESINKNFIVTYSDDNGGSVSYYIIQKHKPIWPKPVGCAQTYTTIEQARDYCHNNPSDYTCCYRDLCPFITKVSQEGEGDEERGAQVSLNDLADNWIVNLTVPAIIGNVAQAHTGGLINDAGDYGCDISINTDPRCEDGFCQTNENCSTCSQDCGACGNGFTTPSNAGGVGGDPLAGGEIFASQGQVLADKSGPNLEITKSVKVRQANPGSTINYEIKITNAGSLTANNVIVEDELPAGFTFNDGGGNKKSWQLKDMAPGNSKSFVYAVKIDNSIKTGVYKNTAVVYADNNDKVSASADIEVNKVQVLGLELVPSGFATNDLLLIFSLITIFCLASITIKKYNLT